MNKEVQIFKNNEFGQVRTLVIDGEPYFVGKDVAEVLGYADTFGALKKHVDDEDKQNCQNSSFESNRGLTVINESGLYSLILGSKLPSAKKFKRWVTSEVLPQIRKTGSYGNQDLLLQVLSQLPQEQIKLIINTLSSKLLPAKSIEETLHDFLSDNLESLSLTFDNFVQADYELFKNYFESRGYNSQDVLSTLHDQNLIEVNIFGFCVKGKNIVIKKTPSLKFYEE